MCGIAGYVRFDDQLVDEATLVQMTDALMHRGPDNSGTKIIGKVGLGHRRLSIIDLSDEANQPMTSDDGQTTIVYNGEVYNFVEIKQRLHELGYRFETHSDTEVVLKAFEEFGTDCFKLFNGMFAIAIYEVQKQRLILVRDPFGIKPLYYYKNDSILVFASEMKSLVGHPEIRLEMSNQGLSEYIWFGNPLGNNTIYKEINEVGAGSFMEISDGRVELTKYFRVEEIRPIATTEENAVHEIRRLFEESVKRHLISDVPVGIFLSGGIDSSAITAIASRHYQGKISTYSVGFDFSKGPNELKAAAKLAQQYGTEHHEIHITGENLVGVIENLVKAHDEPFGDAADIPLFLLTQRLKGDIKVVLQGDGGDEFFGGYSRYSTLHNVDKWRRFSFLPKLIQWSGTTHPKFLRLQRFITAICQKDPAVRNALMLTIESQFTKPLRIFNAEYRCLLRDVDPFRRYQEVYRDFSPLIDPVQALFYTDAQIILKDTFFEKVDKSTMAHSMEVRVPFLDKDLTTYMLSLPAAMKVKGGVKKYLFKKAMEGIVPDAVLYGKKTGFSVPYGFWLRTTLADYFVDQISTDKASVFLDKSEIMKLFALHKEEKGNYGFLLWKTLILAIWINKQ